MIALTLTTDSLEIDTDRACDVDTAAFYTDRDATTFTVGLAQKNLANATAAGQVTLVASPGTNTTRNVKALHIRNAHATNDVIVTVRYNANTVIYEMISVRLRAQDSLTYTEWDGFEIVRVSPVLLDFKCVLRYHENDQSGSAGDNRIATETVTPFLVAGRRYNFMACLFAGSQATTTGATAGFATSGAEDTGGGPPGAETTTVQSSIVAVTLSATAATVAAATADEGTGLNNNAIQTGTGTTNTASTKGLYIISGSILVVGSDVKAGLSLMTELPATSAFSFGRGSWFWVWEATGA